MNICRTTTYSNLSQIIAFSRPKAEDGIKIVFGGMLSIEMTQVEAEGIVERLQEAIKENRKKERRRRRKVE